jgi:tetratricopeptide (TPR) repeat protein
MATGKPETALHFAEAAALADPLNARLCAEAGTACVLAAGATPAGATLESRAAEAASREAERRAEIWFDRGIRLGRWTQEWEWYIRCRIRAGMQAYELGDYRRAMRSYRGARSTATWRGFPDLAGKAHHDMMLIECAVGTYDQAEAHLNAALANYPVRYPRLPQLAHDAAYMFVCWGAFQAALDLLEVVYPLVQKPTERIAVMGTLARAAAGVGDHNRYRDAVSDVLLYAALSEINAAAALVLAAEGALDFRDWARSADLASYGLRVAEMRREREPQRRARIVLERAAAQKPPEYPSIAAARVHRARVLVLSRLARLNSTADPDEARSELRVELTKFTMSAR